METVLQQIHDVCEVHENMHFVYTSGEHGDGYVDYRALGSHENLHILRSASLLLFKRLIQKKKLNRKRRITLVGPETLGAMMVTQIFYASVDEFPAAINRRQLQELTFKKVPGENRFEFAQPVGVALDASTQVVWFDDQLTTSSTFAKTMPLVVSHGAQIVALCVIGDRSGLSAKQIGVKHVESLEQFDLKRYDPQDAPCPLCKQGIPIVRKPGHGDAYQKQHPHYKGGYVDLPL